MVNLLGLNQLTGFYLGCGKIFTILEKNCHNLKFVNTVLGTLKVMGDNREINHLKNFNNADKITQRIENYQKQNIASWRIHKHQNKDHNLSKGDFHTTVVKPFIYALIEEMKGAFDTSNLLVLNAFLKLDLWDLLDRDSLWSESYCEEELNVLHDFYGIGKQDMFQGKMVEGDTFYDAQFLALLLEFRNFKSYVSQQK